MDITFRTPEGCFNLRAAAVILHEGRILAMKDDNSPYYYLPGGRIRLHETADSAVLREVREELGVEARIIRPLWVNQGFFNEDVTHIDFHEICVYYLIDVKGTSLPLTGEGFLRQEGHRIHRFTWLRVDQLKDEYFYPLFLKDRLHALPEALELIASYD
ncbi:MAG: NUDIX domain-containing protein [Clostridia bacterium]|nr:NUDIX domain-containing protein [Clostridia bacterium]